jgi:hypothetical protein
MKRLATPVLAVLAVAVVTVLLPADASALCDISQARVIHAQSTPFNSATATGMVYWVAPSSTTPTFYFVYTTTNQTYINLLNAALISGKQVRVTGSAAACPAAGTLRSAGIVVGVFMDLFQ